MRGHQLKWKKEKHKQRFGCWDSSGHTIGRNKNVWTVLWPDLVCTRTPRACTAPHWPGPLSLRYWSGSQAAVLLLSHSTCCVQPAAWWPETKVNTRLQLAARPPSLVYIIYASLDWILIIIWKPYCSIKILLTNYWTSWWVVTVCIGRIDKWIQKPDRAGLSRCHFGWTAICQ